MALTLAQIDDELTRLRAIPEDERGDVWQVYLNRLLEERLAAS